MARCDQNLNLKLAYHRYNTYKAHIIWASWKHKRL